MNPTAKKLHELRVYFQRTVSNLKAEITELRAKAATKQAQYESYLHCAEMLETIEEEESKNG